MDDRKNLRYVGRGKVAARRVAVSAPWGSRHGLGLPVDPNAMLGVGGAGFAGRSRPDAANQESCPVLLRHGAPRSQIVRRRSALPWKRPQISQPVKFNALRKPPNAFSRQGSGSLAAFER